MKQSLVVFAITLGTYLIASGQSPAPSLWPGDAVNPNGERPIPMVVYEPDTGLMWINTLGLNQAYETASGDLIGGDDVGLIAISIFGPEPYEVFLGGFVEDELGGISWSSQYFSTKQDLFGIPVSSEFLQPTSRIDLFRYPTGLTSRDFGSVAIGVNVEMGQPIQELFGSLQFANRGLDLNADGNFDCGDANLLADAVATTSDDLAFDMNGDGFINSADFDNWLQRLGTFRHGPQHEMIIGDSNFDGFVDVVDFNVWNANKFTYSTAYCDGNFNLDDRIDVSDFNIWLSRKFQSSTAVAIVPEPNLEPLIFAISLLLLTQSRKRSE